MDTCKGCGAEIIWVCNVAHNRIPLSVASHQKRYIRPLDDNGPALLADTYLSHFADCPKGDTFRKRLKKPA